MSYDPNARAKTSPDPYGRQIGESYRDACERMLGQLRAQEADLARLRPIEQRALIVAGEATGPPPGGPPSPWQSVVTACWILRGDV